MSAPELYSQCDRLWEVWFGMTIVAILAGLVGYFYRASQGRTKD